MSRKSVFESNDRMSNLKKVIFIDYDSVPGHLCFNTIWLNALVDISNIELSVCMEKRYADNFPDVLNKPCVRFIEIPKRLYKDKLWRFFSTLRVLWLLNRIKHRYDMVIISAFDSVSFYCGSILSKENVFLICHNNIAKTQKAIHRFCLKRIGKKNRFIVFEDYIKAKLSNLVEEKRIAVVHHGCPKPFLNPDDNHIPEWIKALRSKKIVFSPSGNSMADIFSDTHRNQQFCEYLSRKGYVLVVKSKELFKDSNIVWLDRRLSDAEYQSLFLSSDFILAPYSRNYSYRVSAILFEALSNKKAIICSDIPALRIYEAISDNVFFFDSLTDLISVLEESEHRVLNAKTVPRDYLVPDVATLLTNIHSTTNQ